VLIGVEFHTSMECSLTCHPMLRMVLWRSLQALMTHDIEEEVNRRIAEVLEVKEAEFEKLVGAWQDAEQHLVNEADLAHQEVLEMRKANYRLEMSLRDSEAKRCHLMQSLWA